VPTTDVQRLNLNWRTRSLPEDRFIFRGLAKGLIESPVKIRPHVADIESMNTSALKGSVAVTRASFGAVPLLKDNYKILRVGNIIVQGSGPVLVARSDRPLRFEDIGNALIAIPGELTTAFMICAGKLRREYV